MAHFVISFHAADSKIPVRLDADDGRFSAKLESVQCVAIPQMPYEGAYEITPTVKGFTLPTAQKTMKEDLTVKKIPFFDVGNTSGGSTVYIAAELDFN